MQRVLRCSAEKNRFEKSIPGLHTKHLHPLWPTDLSPHGENNLPRQKTLTPGLHT
jgi:hypothetical protein